MNTEELIVIPERLKPPIFVKKTLLPPTENVDYGCGGAAIAPDGNVYVLPKITSKGSNERGYQNIGHGLFKLDATGTELLNTVQFESVLRTGPMDTVTYEGEDESTIGTPSHWSRYTDHAMFTPLKWEGEIGSQKAVPAQEGVSITVESHAPYEGYEDVRVAQLPTGEYIFTAVGIDAEQWWKAGWTDKTSRIQGCRVAMGYALDIADPSTYSEMMQIGPDYVFRNAFFTPETFENGQGEQCMRLIYRDLPNIYQSVIPVTTLFAMTRDPKLREEFWKKELSEQQKKHTLLMKPKFDWEAVREGEKWGHGQIASGCSVKVSENRQLLITGSPYAIDEKGVTKGRVIGVSLLETDANNPSIIRVISRGTQPLLTPTEDDEKFGKVEDVVFSTGACVIQQADTGERNLNIYYTGADSSFKVATGSLEETLTWLDTEENRLAAQS